MSNYHIPCIDLIASFNPKTIHELLSDGYKNNYIYLDGTTPLSIGEATKNTLIAEEENIHKLYVKYYDIYLYLIFSQDKANNITLMLDILEPAWCKEFLLKKTKIMQDNARYARLLLNLCQNFFIKNFYIFSHLQIFDELEVQKGFHVALDIDANLEELKESAHLFLKNAYENSYIVLNKNLNHISDAQSDESLLRLIKTGTAVFYLQIKPHLIKVHIESSLVSFIIIDEGKKIILPSGELIIDIKFYIEALLNFCENFGILELKVNL